MREGSFQAVGMEVPSKWHPIRLGIIFLLTGLLVLIFFRITDLTGTLTYVENDLFIFLVLAMMISFAPVTVIGGRIFNHVHQYNIFWFDERQDGQDLRIQYVDLQSGREKTMIVAKLKASRFTPLRKMKNSVLYKIEGTACSMTIFSKSGTRNLRLGFPSIQEMDQVCQSLLGGNHLSRNWSLF